jgi:FkbM family methyltransferase
MKWRLRHRFAKIDRFGKRYTIFRSVFYRQNFAQPLRYLIWGKHSKRKGFEKSNYGVWISERLDDITYLRCRSADYLNGLNRMIESVSEESVFIDIGSNIGIFSLIANKNKNIGAVYSFEPSESSFELLQKNANENGSKKINLYRSAIGPENKSTRLSTFEGHSGRSAIKDTTGGIAEDIEMINQEVLNVIFQQITCSVMVKIDVEGYELEVLKTLQKTDLFNRIKHFHIEFDVTEGHPDEVQSFLQLANFVEVKRWGDESHWDAYWIQRSAKPLI